MPLQPKNSKLPYFNAIRAAVTMIGGLGIVLSIALFLLPPVASFEFIRDQLLSRNLFRPENVIRYFNREMIDSVGRNLRIGAALLLVAASGLLWLRQAIARACAEGSRALVLGWRHARRRSVARRTPHAFVLLLITALAVGLRIQYMHRGIRYDEAFTVLYFASKPIYVGLINYGIPNNHILHTLLVHWAILLFGAGEWAIRLPAFVAGVLIVPLAYAFASRLAGPSAGILAATFTATSSILIEYSINARGYTMICAFTLAIAICAIEIRRQVSPVWCFLFALSATLGFWTIPTFLFSVGGPIAWLIWESFDCHLSRRGLLRKRLVIIIFLTGICTTVLYAPAIILNGPAALVANKAESSWPVVLEGNLSVFTAAIHQWMRDLGTLMPIAISSAALLGIAVCSSLRRLVLVTLGFAVAVLLVVRFVPFPRTWLVYLPVFLVAAASGIAWLLQRSMPVSMQKFAALALSILILVATGVPVLRSRSILESTETGVLLGAEDQVAYLAKRNIPAASVYRDWYSDIPLQYYWWRHLGKKQPCPTAAEIRLFEPREAWIVVNVASIREKLSDDLPTILGKLGIADYEVLETAEFTGSKLCRVRWTRLASVRKSV